MDRDGVRVGGTRVAGKSDWQQKAGKYLRTGAKEKSEPKGSDFSNVVDDIGLEPMT